MSEFDRDGFYRQVGRRMKAAREESGLTQNDLAAQLGMPRSSYTNMELGRQRTPADVLWRVSVVLGVPTHTLLPSPKKNTPAEDGYEINTDRTSSEREAVVVTSESLQENTAQVTTNSSRRHAWVTT